MKIHIESGKDVLDEVKQLIKEADRRAKGFREKAALEDAKIEALEEALQQVEKLVEFEKKRKDKINAENKGETRKDEPKHILAYRRQFMRDILQSPKTYNGIYGLLTKRSTQDTDYWNTNILDFMIYLLEHNYVKFVKNGDPTVLVKPTDYEIQDGTFIWNPDAPAC